MSSWSLTQLSKILVFLWTLAVLLLRGKMNSGAVALLVWLTWISLNAAIQTRMCTYHVLRPLEKVGRGTFRTDGWSGLIKNANATRCRDFQMDHKEEKGDKRDKRVMPFRGKKKWVGVKRWAGVFGACQVNKKVCQSFASVMLMSGTKCSFL